MRISKNMSKNIVIMNLIEEKDKKCIACRDTLRVLRAETWLTVYRTIAILPNRGELTSPWTREDSC